MKADTWMPLYIADYLRDASHLSPEEHGGYLLLIMGCWTRGGVLPAEESKLAAIAHMPPAAWKRSRAAILEFFTRTEAGLIHGRITAELEKAQRLSETRRQAGAKGGRPKSQTESKPKANGFANGEQNETPACVAPPSPSSLRSETSSEANASGRRAPAEPADDPDTQAWALAVDLLRRQAGLDERKARTFFGGLLKRHGRRASELLIPLVHAEDSGTIDPQPYLEQAAQNLRRNGRERPGRPTDEDTADRLTRVWTGAAAQAGRA